MIGLSLTMDIVDRINDRFSRLSIPVSRNAFISSLIKAELDKMDDMDYQGENGDSYAIGFVNSTHDRGRPKGAPRRYRRTNDGKIFNTAKEAAASVGISTCAFYQAIREGRATRDGSKWEYVN